MLYSRKHFDTSGKSAAPFHHRTICKTADGAARRALGVITGKYQCNAADAYHPSKSEMGRSFFAGGAMTPAQQQWHWQEGNKYAPECMKALLLLNGGGALALLTFAVGRQHHTDVVMSRSAPDFAGSVRTLSSRRKIESSLCSAALRLFQIA